MSSRKKTVAVIFGVTVGLLVGVASCNSDDPKPTPVPAQSKEAPKADNSSTKSLPNLVGMVLQDAQDKAQAAGFYGLNDKDALYDRFQVIDSNWKVCSQEPGPGAYNPDTTNVVLYAVKLDETCP